MQINYLDLLGEKVYEHQKVSADSFIRRERLLNDCLKRPLASERASPNIYVSSEALSDLRSFVDLLGRLTVISETDEIIPDVS